MCRVLYQVLEFISRVAPDRLLAFFLDRLGYLGEAFRLEHGIYVMRLRAELERHGLMNALESDVDCIVTGNFAVCLSRIFEKERGDWCSY